ncbi:hypothetical protein [Microvirga sp. Mcv34]|uniref:hypothetical protein n=1 Tax=Microvirga sp. Mcv34 TaxID=2926016 RepID=UPI0021C83BB9|nr:hypothetical protein [Microvirga sp. Mcv34]
MYAFKDFNRQYALHIRNHNLLSGGFLITIGVIGATLNMRPMVIFIALLGSLLAGMLARVLLVYGDYTGGLQFRHVWLILLGAILSFLLLLFAYWALTQKEVPDHKRGILAFFMANFLLMHLPFLIVHCTKRSDLHL